jgi:nucleoside 2-deoxyribosyltransferase
MTRKIYLASSWKNQQQPNAVMKLRGMGHEVYDFRIPTLENVGFNWKQCQMEGGEQINMHDIALYIRHITHNSMAQTGFKLDYDALNWCDTCILLLPCGRSAHLEAGYAIGQGKETFIVLDKDGFEPELMYLLADHICETFGDLIVSLNHAREQHCDVSYSWP